MAPVGRHEVFGFDRPHGQHVFIGPRVAHHADALHRQQHGEDLRRLAIEPRRLDFVDHDRVGLAQRVQPLLGHFADAAHGQPRAGERMPPDDLFRQAQLQAQLAALRL